MQPFAFSKYCTTSTLQQIRMHKCDAMLDNDRTKIDPAVLPPSPRAVFYHGLRVYHQVHVWKDLSKVDEDPLRWGWTIENNMYTPIMTDVEAGPPELLKVIRCGCKGPCENNCSCRTAGLKCTSSCKECHGITCTNASVIEPDLQQEVIDRCV